VNVKQSLASRCNKCCVKNAIFCKPLWWCIAYLL